MQETPCCPPRYGLTQCKARASERRVKPVWTIPSAAEARGGFSNPLQIYHHAIAVHEWSGKKYFIFFECPRRSAVTMVIWSFGQNRFRSVKSSTIINILYLYIVSKWPNPRMKMTILTLTTLTGILGETCILAYILCYVFVYTKMSQSIIVKILSQNSIIMFIYVKYWLCEQNFIVNVCLFEKSDSSLHWKDFEIIRIWVKS